MKCLLLNSPIYREKSEVEEEYLPPLGLGYIATHLNNCHIRTEIIDCVKERLGMTEIFNVLRHHTPEYIGINIFTLNYELVKEIAENCPIQTTIIIGGQVVKSIYEDILQWEVSNELIVVIGEGEFLLPALISGECSERPIINVNKKRVYKVDKDSAYFPSALENSILDRAFFEDYIIKNHYGENEAAIITSRGCMYNCAFCGGAHNLNRDVTIRYRTFSSVEEEIREIIAKASSITFIRVLDDLFLRDEVSINNAIMMFNKFEKLSWRGMAHVLTFAKSFESLPKLRESGCRELFVGIESGSETMRRKINKPGSVQKVIDVVSAILDSGIDVKGYFMYGFPGETVEQAEATFSLASVLAEASKNTEGCFRTSVFQFRPYHGTRLYDEIVEAGRKVEKIKSNMTLNSIARRSQFNFQSGNYSEIEDGFLNELFLKTQLLSRDLNV